MRITADTSLADLLLAAQTALRDVEPGEIFTVRDLFRGFEWNRLPRGVPSKLGTLFFVYAEKEGKDLIEIPKEDDKNKKTKQNQQLYIKK